MRVKRIVSLLTAAAISASMMMTANAAQRFNGSYFGSGFDSYEWGTMEAADGWSNGGMFDCTWSFHHRQQLAGLQGR